MATATFTLFNAFSENVSEKVFNLGSDTLKIALTNTAPVVGSNSVLTDITEVSYTYLSTRSLTISSSAQSGGTYKLVIADITLTSSGGTTGPFRYVVIYDDTASSDQLIGYLDYGSALTLRDGDALTVDFDGTNGLLTLT